MIIIHVKPDDLRIISNNLQTVYLDVVNRTWEEKLSHSIGLDLADKFQSKQKKQIKKANLFETNKLLKITLKYHEAWALYQILQSLIMNQSGYREQLRVQEVINKLNQKLT